MTIAATTAHTARENTPSASVESLRSPQAMPVLCTSVNWTMPANGPAMCSPVA